MPQNKIFRPAATIIAAAGALSVVAQGAVADSPKMVDMPPAGAFVVPVVTSSGGSFSNSQIFHVMNPASEDGEVFDASQPSTRKPDQAQYPRRLTLLDVLKRKGLVQP